MGISIEQNRCHSDGCSSRSPVYSCQQSAWQAPGLPEYLTASYSCSLSGCSLNTHVVLTSSRKHPRHSRGDYSSSHVTGLTVVHDVSRKTTETRRNCRHPLSLYVCNDKPISSTVSCSSGHCELPRWSAVRFQVNQRGQVNPWHTLHSATGISEASHGEVIKWPTSRSNTCRDSQ